MLVLCVVCGVCGVWWDAQAVIPGTRHPFEGTRASFYYHRTSLGTSTLVLSTMAPPMAQSMAEIGRCLVPRYSTALQGQGAHLGYGG